MPRTPATYLRPSVQVTDRDRWIAAAVHEHRVLTSHQLATLAFDSIRGAQRRLTALTRLGVLDRFRPAMLTGSAPGHYVLGPVGAALLSTPDHAVRCLGLPADSPILRHTIGVNSLYVDLATAQQHDPGVRLERWWGERTCIAWWGRHARPDAYGRWTSADSTGRNRRVDFFVEFDTGSENLPRVVAKLDGYRRLAASTGITTPILFCLPNTEREANLHERLTGRLLDRTPVATTTNAILAAVAHPGDQVWLSNAANARVGLVDLAEPLPETASGEGTARSDGWTPPLPLPPARS